MVSMAEGLATIDEDLPLFSCPVSVELGPEEPGSGGVTVD